MPKGGYRPGAGRPKGSRTAAKKTEGQSAPAAPRRPADADPLTPLEYMLAVLNDEEADVARRDRMAIAAAPYVHARTADAAPGKKEQQIEAARSRARGKFAPPPPPRGAALN